MSDTLSLDEILEKYGRVSPEQLRRACAMASETGQGLGFVVTQLGLLSERALADLYAEVLDVDPVREEEYPLETLFFENITPKFLRRAYALPIGQNEDNLVVAMVDPLDAGTIHAIAFSTGFNVIPRPALLSELDTALGRLFPEKSGLIEKSDLSSEIDKGDVVRLQDAASGAPVIRYVDRLISEAVDARASDIHLESIKHGLRIRLRIDGVLHEYKHPPATWSASIISRVKLMAGLDIAERRLSQDGRIRITVRGHEIDIRIATTPTIFGESVTLRILDREHVNLDFEKLGFDEEVLGPWLKVLENQTGMVLVTGPTGSGKTTTLYASLQRLNSPEVKILTIEDPVEYILEGVNQVQVKPAIGLTFANMLRSFLRHDPDILLVGEIRDLETAEIATQAALTGHRVLSTLHTNDAATGITRLLDMGVAEYLISSTVTAILAQRLVRNLCPHCCESFSATAEMVDRYRLNLFSSEKPVTLWKACGCSECNRTGYKGRSVIAELLPVTGAIRQLILRRAEAGEILQAAQKEGMRTMFEHGLIKAVRGQTTIEEVLRVVGDD